MRTGSAFVNTTNFARRVCRRLNPIIRKDDYLRILGVFDGSYAFRGPEFVQIDLTDYCNNTCLACWCNSPLLKEKKFSEEKPRHTMPLDMVKRLLDELVSMGTKEVAFSGSGEPFMHPDIMEILAYAKKKRFTCIVNTNFTLLDKDRLRSLADLGIDFLTVSVWAASGKVYAHTHPGRSEDDFNRIKENLIFLNSYKKEKPTLHLYNVIFNKNYFEFEEMIEFALKTHSEMVGFALVDTIPGSTDSLILNEGELLSVQEACKRVKSRLDIFDRLKGSGLLCYGFVEFLRRVSDSIFARDAKYDKNIIDSLPCYNGWLFARVIPNGEVHSCLKAHRIPVGSLYKMNFSKIWNSPQQILFRRNTCVYRKNAPFFNLIGNDPELGEAGCYKGCDDIGRNIHMHKKIKRLFLYEKVFLKSAAGLLKLARKARGAKFGTHEKAACLPVINTDSLISIRRPLGKWIALFFVSFLSFFYMTYVWILQYPKNELSMRTFRKPEKIS